MVESARKTPGGIPAQSAAPLWRQRLRVRVLRSTGMFGKDVLRGVRVCGGLGVLMFSLWFGIRILSTVFEGSDPFRPVFAFQFFMPILAFVLGLSLTGEEEEEDTRFFTDRLPAPRMGQLAAKVVAGLTLWLAGVAVCGLVWSLITFDWFYHDLSRSYRGHWLTHSRGALWCLTLFLTGLTTGAFFRRNLILAAVAGYAGLMMVQGVLCIVFGLSGVAGDGTTTTLGQFMGKGNPLPDTLWNIPMSERPIPSLMVCCVCALSLLMWRFHARIEIEEGKWVRLAGMIPRVRPRKAAMMSAVEMSHRDVRVWGLRFGVGAGLGAFVLNAVWADQNAFGTTLFVLLVLALKYGISANPADETDLRTFHLHTLPVDFTRLTSARTRRLAMNAVAMTGAGFAGILVAWAVSDVYPGPRIRSLSGGSLAWSVFPMMAGGAVAMALLGYLSRFFFAKGMIAFFAAGVIGAILASVVVAVAEVNGDLLLWSIPVAIALPWIAIHVVTKHSLLLEMNSGARAASWLLVMLLLIVHGAIIMTLWPMDILHIVF